MCDFPGELKDPEAREKYVQWLQLASWMNIADGNEYNWYELVHRFMNVLQKGLGGEMCLPSMDVAKISVPTSDENQELVLLGLPYDITDAEVERALACFGSVEKMDDKSSAHEKIKCVKMKMKYYIPALIPVPNGLARVERCNNSNKGKDDLFSSVCSNVTRPKLVENDRVTTASKVNMKPLELSNSEQVNEISASLKKHRKSLGSENLEVGGDIKHIKMVTQEPAVKNLEEKNVDENVKAVILKDIIDSEKEKDDFLKPEKQQIKPLDGDTSKHIFYPTKLKDIKSKNMEDNVIDDSIPSTSKNEIDLENAGLNEKSLEYMQLTELAQVLNQDGEELKPIEIVNKKLEQKNFNEKEKSVISKDSNDSRKEKNYLLACSNIEQQQFAEIGKFMKEREHERKNCGLINAEEKTKGNDDAIKKQTKPMDNSSKQSGENLNMDERATTSKHKVNLESELPGHKNLEQKFSLDENAQAVNLKGRVDPENMTQHQLDASEKSPQIIEEQYEQCINTTERNQGKQMPRSTKKEADEKFWERINSMPVTEFIITGITPRMMIEKVERNNTPVNTTDPKEKPAECVATSCGRKTKKGTGGKPCNSKGSKNMNVSTSKSVMGVQPGKMLKESANKKKMEEHLETKKDDEKLAKPKENV